MEQGTMEKTEIDVIRKYLHGRWNVVIEQTVELVLNKEKAELIIKCCREAEEKMMEPEDCPNLMVAISTIIRDSIMHRPHRVHKPPAKRLGIDTLIKHLAEEWEIDLAYLKAQVEKMAQEIKDNPTIINVNTDPHA